MVIVAYSHQLFCKDREYRGSGLNNLPQYHICGYHNNGHNTQIGPCDSYVARHADR